LSGDTTAATADWSFAATARATGVLYPVLSMLRGALLFECVWQRLDAIAMYTTPVRVCKECSLKCQRAEALVRAISQGNAELVQVRMRAVAACDACASCLLPALRQPWTELQFLCRFFSADNAGRVDGTI
jgi:hypothetical protein